MPKQISEAELADIVDVIAAHPAGAAIEQIKNGLEAVMPRRTLQHRLAHLVEQNRIQMLGRGRGTRYSAIPEAGSDLRPAVDRAAETQAPAGIPRSKEGKEVEAAVSQPIQARQPVGYNPEFLEAYRPNVSFYLDEGIRENLRDKGRAPDSSTTTGTCARYSAMRQSLGEPDPFRLRYREKILAAVTHVVSAYLDKPKAVHFIQKKIMPTVPENDRARFVEVVETELISLHEGNIARYRLLPNQYAAWREGWK